MPASVHAPAREPGMRARARRERKHQTVDIASRPTKVRYRKGARVRKDARAVPRPCVAFEAATIARYREALITGVRNVHATI